MRSTSIGSLASCLLSSRFVRIRSLRVRAELKAQEEEGKGGRESPGGRGGRRRGRARALGAAHAAARG